MRKLEINIYKVISMMLILILIASPIKTLIVSNNNTSVEKTNDKINNESTKEITYNSTLKDKTLLDVKKDKNEISNVSVDTLSTSESVVAEAVEMETCNINNNDTIETKTNQEQNTTTYSDYEIYELAKIIMCEAEGESQLCKEYVGQVVLNRVKSTRHPNTIHDVIFAKNQFTPTFDGRWERVEPNQACYDAAYKVINATEPLTDALFFESCKGDSWHSRNLTLVASVDNTKFYTY